MRRAEFDADDSAIHAVTAVCASNVVLLLHCRYRNDRAPGSFCFMIAIRACEAAMDRRHHGRGPRDDALARASAYSPFLRDALAALSRHRRIVRCRRAPSAAIAVALGGGRRRPRASSCAGGGRGLALAVALGDLAGELSLEQVTALCPISPTGRSTGRSAPRSRERVPGRAGRGLAVIALGKLGSRELNYSSDVDLHPAVRPGDLPRRERDDAGEAAVRIGRRLIELLQQRTADGYVARVDLRLRPSPEVTPIVLPVDAAISHYEISALPWERAAFIRARAAAGDRRARRALPGAIEPFVWRRALDFGVIDEIRDISRADPRPFRAGRSVRPRLRPQARARRHPRGRILHPGPADDPRRPRPGGARAGDARRARRAGRGRPPRRRRGRGARRRLPRSAHRSSTGCR